MSTRLSRRERALPHDGVVSRVESAVARGDAREPPHASTAKRRDAPPPLRPRESDGIAPAVPLSHSPLPLAARVAPLFSRRACFRGPSAEIYRLEDISDIIQGHLCQMRIKRSTVFARSDSSPVNRSQTELLHKRASASYVFRVYN